MKNQETPNTLHNGPVEPDTPTPGRTTRQRLFAVGLIILICAGGLAAAKWILDSKPKPVRKKPQQLRTLVRVSHVFKQQVDIRIQTLGTVISARTLNLKPAISGTVRYVHPNLVPGGNLNKGDLVLELDERDYKLAYERNRNRLEKALQDLRLEQGNQTVARREFDLIREYTGSEFQDAPMDLALRKPQLAKAKAEEAAARTDMKTAELNLERTRLRAPFNAIVLDKSVATGSQVNSQSTVAVLAGTDVYWVRVSLQQNELALITLPKEGNKGSSVQITSIGHERKYSRSGYISRLLADVDPQGMMARVLVEIPNPTLQSTGQPPLLLGSIVNVEIQGKSIGACYAIPRNAVNEDRTVFVATPANTLDIRPVTIIREEGETAYIQQGLEDGERVITSPLAAPIQGMKLTVTQKKPAS